MPKGIFERTDKHREASRKNGRKVKGKLPHNSKYKPGLKVGFLTLEERITPIGKTNSIQWRCRCDCGNETIRTANQLSRRDSVKHCGCKPKNRPPNFSGYEDITGTFWSRIRKQANDRNYSFNITKEEVWELYLRQNKKCVLSGKSISFLDKTASIDRINSKIGYELNNIQILHKDVNKIKVDFSQEYLVELCSDIHLNRIFN